uniref:Putative secreted protein n=1 Tax=Anopheles darlingi TaxID=43151 RepID=A0A2M4D5G2_ANODA
MSSIKSVAAAACLGHSLHALFLFFLGQLHVRNSSTKTSFNGESSSSKVYGALVILWWKVPHHPSLLRYNINFEAK